MATSHTFGLVRLLTVSACLVAGGFFTSVSALGPSRSIEEHAEFLLPHIDVRLPSNVEGPVASALLFHGCGGRRAMQDEYADALNAAGFGAIIIDSLEPRGIGRFGAMTQVCTALRLRGQARAADIYAGVELARQTPGVDSDRLVLVGWSHGGWAILDAVTYHADDTRVPGLSGGTDLAGVRGALLMSPYCGLPARSRNHSIDAGIALDAVLAGRDLVASTADCRRTLDQARDDGAEVTYEVWSGLTHAFDEAGNPDPRMQYNEGAAQAAHARLIGLLEHLSAR